MDCFDSVRALNAVIGATLIVSGSHLMMHIGNVARAFGAYAFALGYFVLALAAIGSTNHHSNKFIIGMASALAIVAGTFMMYYHVQDRAKKALENHLKGLPLVKDDIIKSIPLIYHLLVYLGFAGLVLTIGMNNDGTFNWTKGALALAALVVIGYTKTRLLEAAVDGKNLEKHQIAHILSWGLIVIAVGYNC